MGRDSLSSTCFFFSTSSTSLGSGEKAEQSSIFKYYPSAPFAVRLPDRQRFRNKLLDSTRSSNLGLAGTREYRTQHQVQVDRCSRYAHYPVLYLTEHTRSASLSRSHPEWNVCYCQTRHYSGTPMKNNALATRRYSDVASELFVGNCNDIFVASKVSKP